MERIPKGIYTLEFRAEAVKLVEEGGLSVDAAAKRLSVAIDFIWSESTSPDELAGFLNSRRLPWLPKRAKNQSKG